MKTLVVLFVIISFWAKAQNYIITPQNLNPVGAPGDLLFAPILVTNITNDSIQFEYSRISLNIPSGWLSCVCLPVCMDPTKPMHDAFMIPANSTQTVMPNFQTDTIPSIGYSTFIFFETGVNNYDTLSFSGSTLSAGINELKNKNTSSFIVYPNPINEKVTVKNIEEIIKGVKIYTSLGIEVLEIVVQSLQNEIEIPLSDHSSGNYYIEIETINNTIYRKKIIKL